MGNRMGCLKCFESDDAVGGFSALRCVKCRGKVQENDASFSGGKVYHKKCYIKGDNINMSTALLSPSDFQVYHCHNPVVGGGSKKQDILETRQLELSRTLRCLRTTPRNDSDELFSLTHPPSEGILVLKVLSNLFEISCHKKLWRHLKSLPFELVVEHLVSQSPEFTAPGTPLHMSLLDLSLKYGSGGAVLRNRLLSNISDWCLAYYELCPSKQLTRNEIHIRAEAKAAEIIRQYEMNKQQ